MDSSTVVYPVECVPFTFCHTEDDRVLYSCSHAEYMYAQEFDTAPWSYFQDFTES